MECLRKIKSRETEKERAAASVLEIDVGKEAMDQILKDIDRYFFLKYEPFICKILFSWFVFCLLPLFLNNFAIHTYSVFT